jgi:hypothetical protein
MLSGWQIGKMTDNSMPSGAIYHIALADVIYFDALNSASPFLANITFWNGLATLEQRGMPKQLLEEFLNRIAAHLTFNSNFGGTLTLAQCLSEQIEIAKRLLQAMSPDIGIAFDSSVQSIVPEAESIKPWEPKLVFILLLRAGSEQEGIHTIKAGNDNTVLMFESRDTADEFREKLEQDDPQNFSGMKVEELDSREIEIFCQKAGYLYQIIPSGTLIEPPKSSVDITDWQVYRNA